MYRHRGLARLRILGREDEFRCFIEVAGDYRRFLVRAANLEKGRSADQDHGATQVVRRPQIPGTISYEKCRFGREAMFGKRPTK
jgi:hypothetical protein